jgi:formylglycine-generating enzyme
MRRQVLRLVGPDDWSSDPWRLGESTCRETQHAREAEAERAGNRPRLAEQILPKLAKTYLEGDYMSTTTTGRAAVRRSRDQMAWIASGTFAMGSNDFYPEERPVHRVTVSGFWIDTHPVTVREFRRFVKATGYVTVAERPLTATDYPGAHPEDLLPGSLVFTGTPGPVPLNDVRRWWDWRSGASWKRPEGSGSNTDGRDQHPVVHIAYEDAATYAAWAEKDLPTEAEWEFAARGGLEGAIFAWGDEEFPRGRPMANTWQGRFPWENLRLDGFVGTSPVGSFPPNGYGLVDMTGNVWEWTSDFFRPRHPDDAAHSCCVPDNPRVSSPDESYGRGQPGENFPRRVIKGGSHLCAPNYCLRYRPAARQAQTIETSLSHLGFRCIRREAQVSD